MGQSKDGDTRQAEALGVEGKKVATSSIAPSGRRQGKKVPRSDAFEAIHSAATALHAVGAINKKTMREYDESCFMAPAFTARDVQRIRRKERISQEVLARYMGITKSTVAKWESAQNTPSPMAQRLLKVIDDQGIDVLA